MKTEPTAAAEIPTDGQRYENVIEALRDAYALTWAIRAIGAIDLLPPGSELDEQWQRSMRLLRLSETVMREAVEEENRIGALEVAALEAMK